MLARYVGNDNYRCKYDSRLRYYRQDGKIMVNKYFSGNNFTVRGAEHVHNNIIRYGLGRGRHNVEVL